MAKAQYTLVLSTGTTGGIGINSAGPAAGTQLWLTRLSAGPGVISLTTPSDVRMQNRTNIVPGPVTGSPEKLNSRSGAVPYALYEQGSDGSAGGIVVRFAGVGGYRKFTWTPNRPDRPIGGDVPAANGATGFQQVEGNATDTKVYSWHWQAQRGDDAWHGRRRPRTRNGLWNANRYTSWGGPTDPIRNDSLVVMGRVDFP